MIPPGPTGGTAMACSPRRPAVSRSTKGTPASRGPWSGGAWYNTETGTAWAYTLTGSADLTEGQSDEVFYPDEELLFLEAF